MGGVGWQEARERAGLSRTCVADHMDWPLFAVALLESGDYKPTEEELKRLQRLGLKLRRKPLKQLLAYFSRRS